MSRRTGVSARSLRYYEQQGLLAPGRTRGGHRVYTAADEVAVHQIKQLLRAGFCSSVIRQLMLPLSCPAGSGALLRSAFDAAEERLVSERRAVDAEIDELRALRAELGLASDVHVRSQDDAHDDELALSHPAPSDHRDRGLRQRPALLPRSARHAGADRVRDAG
ncbi:MerR family transcriptional regulator [Cellulomonas telluris]|uniref:MerR family transcriptional regulator n=1 Tax=Cellulomonas telluris TaxID=2306636 RepID=UPI003522E045